MSREFSYIAPLPPASIDILEAHQVTYQFHHEVRHRQEFERYCEWYYATVQHHQQEFQRMQNDINLFGWFCRGRRASARRKR